MSRKQKVVSSFPSLKEWHAIGGYNFNGPGTRVTDRISLNYKGKVGTESYFLPKNKLDRQAIEHDFMYYQPDNLARVLADVKYYENVRNLPGEDGSKLLSRFFMQSQIISRTLKESSKLALPFVASDQALRDFFKLLSVPPVAGKGSIMGWAFNPAKGVAPPRLKNFFKNWYNIKGTRRGSQTSFRKEILKKYLIPLVLGYGINHILEDGLVQPFYRSYKMIIDTLEHTENWKLLNKNNNEVMKSYDTYLKSVGSYDKTGNFVISTDINVKNAKRQYLAFFTKFKNYIRFVNSNYADHPGFVKHKIPVLNIQNLEKVAFPEMAITKPLVLPDVIKKEIKNQTNIYNKTLFGTDIMQEILTPRQMFSIKSNDYIDLYNQTLGGNITSQKKLVKELSKPENQTDRVELWNHIYRKVGHEIDDFPRLHKTMQIINEISKKEHVKVPSGASEIDYIRSIEDTLEEFHLDEIPHIPEQKTGPRAMSPVRPDGQEVPDSEQNFGSRGLPAGVKITQAENIPVENIEDAKALVARDEYIPEFIPKRDAFTADAENFTSETQVNTSGVQTSEQGMLRPHFKNTTKKAVDQALNKSPEEQIKDFTNFFIFDIPSDQTGQGSSETNPFVKQNEQREAFIRLGEIKQDFNTTYNIFEGVNEDKRFWGEHPKLSHVQAEFTENKNKSEEAEFLKTFNQGNNGLFTQDQSRQEVSKWQPIYQTPNNFFKGTLYPFQKTTNDTLFVSKFKSNLNYFIEP